MSVEEEEEYFVFVMEEEEEVEVNQMLEKEVKAEEILIAEEGHEKLMMLV